MRPRRKSLGQRQAGNQERWLISYADFITLLFALFVVMYALSSVSEGKLRVLGDSLGSAFRINRVKPLEPMAQAPTLDRQPRKLSTSPDSQAKQREEMRGIAQNILKAMGAFVRDGKVTVTQTNGGIAVEINASVLFDSGQAQLRAESRQALTQVAGVLAPTVQRIQVEGYTDNTPISTSYFPSNWELSAARASSVVRLFIDNGVAEPRLSVIGYGPNRPVMSNDTPESRARNRRVTVMILTEIPGKVVDIPFGAAANATR